MNVKAGDLAIVVSDDDRSENIGIICKVIKFHGPVLYLGAIVAEQTWDVESIGRPFEFINGHAPDVEAYVSDSDLRPVSGLPEAEDTKTEQPIKEVA